MHALLGALIVFLLGLLGARFSFTTAGSPAGPRFLFIAGTHFLVVGLVLGSSAVGLLTPAVLHSLYPLLALGIGWVGLLFGMQLDLRQLRAFPPALVLLALLQAVVAFVVFAALALAFFRLAGPLPRGTQAAVAAAAATACISSPLAIALVSRLTRAQGRLAELLLFVSSLDAVVGIVAVQLAYAIYHPLEFGAEYQRGGFEWMALALGVGVAFGILFLWLVRTKPRRDELSVFLLGLALFNAGAALYLGLSALFVAMVSGLLIANLSPLQPRIYAVLQAWEKPVYVMLLVFMGALLDFVSWIVIPLAIGYTAIRIAAKVAGGWVARPVLPAAERPPRDFGLALTPQSGMTFALALSVAISYGALRVEQPLATRLLVATVVLGIVASELFGPALTRGVLRRAESGAPPGPPPVEVSHA